jgi:hypothetical protein
VLLNIKVVLDALKKHDGQLDVDKFYSAIEEFMYSTDHIIQKRGEIVQKMNQYSTEYKK